MSIMETMAVNAMSQPTSARPAMEAGAVLNIKLE
jgi:hypothetical protein